ncbi:MAG TPA: tetratricopeptide repeat protein [Rhizomicrobium sp.]
MRIASLAAVFAAVFFIAAAPASEIPPPDSNGIIDLTNIKYPRDVNPSEFKMPDRHQWDKNDISAQEGHEWYRDLTDVTFAGAAADMTFVIGIDGTVSDEKITVSSGSADFDKAALALASRLLFYPAKAHGKPVAVRMRMKMSGDKFWEGARYRFLFLDQQVSADENEILHVGDDWAMRGHNADVSGNYSEAVTDFDEAVKANPQDVTALSGRSVVHEQLGQYDAAVQDDTLALAVAPQSPIATVGRALAYDALGKHDLAAADRKALASMAPACAPVRIFDDPKCHDAYEARIAVLDKRVADNPKDFAAYRQRCAERAIANAGLSAALADCNRVLDVAPDDAATLAARGLVFYRMEIFPAALKDYDASLKRDPNSANSLYMRGIVEMRMNQAAGKADILSARANDAAVAANMAFCGVYP